MDQHRRHRGVDPARQAADHLVRSHLGADAGHGLLAEGLHGPVALQPRDALDEVAIDGRAAGGVVHLGMELDAIDASRLVGDGGEGRARGGGDHLETLRDGRDPVAMAHPHRLAVVDCADAGEQGRVAHDHDLGAPKFAVQPRLHLAAELGADGLLAVADAQDGHAQFEHPLGHARALSLRHAGRAARQDHRPGREVVQDGADPVIGMDLAIDAAFAHAPGDQLGDLAAEIDDQHTFVARLGGHEVLWNRAMKKPSVPVRRGLSWTQGPPSARAARRARAGSVSMGAVAATSAIGRGVNCG